MAQVKAFSLGGVGHPCCCSAAACNTNICVALCGTNVDGATVTVKSGSTVIGSGTTVAGCVAINIGTAGTYTVVVTITGFPTNTSSHSLTCGGSTTINFGNPPTGTTCCDSCAPPPSLHLTDANGTITLAFINPLFSGPGWWGCTSITVSGVSLSGTDGNTTCLCSSVGSITLQILYTMVCAGSGQVTVVRYWNCVTCPDATGTNRYDAGSVSPLCGGAFDPCIKTISNPAVLTASITSAWTTCAPFAWSGTPVYAPGVGVPNCADPVGGSVTISA